MQTTVPQLFGLQCLCTCVQGLGRCGKKRKIIVCALWKLLITRADTGDEQITDAFTVGFLLTDFPACDISQSTLANNVNFGLLLDCENG